MANPPLSEAPEPGAGSARDALVTSPASDAGRWDGDVVRGADFRQRGVFLYAVCPMCAWEGPARRAFASAVRDLQGHRAGVCSGGADGAPAEAEADGSPEQATEGGLS